MKLKYKGKELELAIELHSGIIGPNIVLSTTYNEQIFEGNGYAWNDAFRELIAELDNHCVI